ncbi:MAG: hypothetical protein ACLTWO_13305 [Blautia massiliensis (ex Durand et al. 2017)]
MGEKPPQKIASFHAFGQKTQKKKDPTEHCNDPTYTCASGIVMFRQILPA